MDWRPQIVLKLLLCGLVDGLIYSLGNLFCVAMSANSGRKGTEGNMYITSFYNKIKNRS